MFSNLIHVFSHQDMPNSEAIIIHATAQHPEYLHNFFHFPHLRKSGACRRRTGIPAAAPGPGAPAARRGCIPLPV